MSHSINSPFLNRRCTPVTSKRSPIDNLIIPDIPSLEISDHECNLNYNIINKWNNDFESTIDHRLYHDISKNSTSSHKHVQESDLSQFMIDKLQIHTNIPQENIQIIHTSFVSQSDNVSKKNQDTNVIPIITSDEIIPLDEIISPEESIDPVILTVSESSLVQKDKLTYIPPLPPVDIKSLDYQQDILQSKLIKNSNKIRQLKNQIEALETDLLLYGKHEFVLKNTSAILATETLSNISRLKLLDAASDKELQTILLVKNLISEIFSKNPPDPSTVLSTLNTLFGDDKQDVDKLRASLKEASILGTKKLHLNLLKSINQSNYDQEITNISELLENNSNTANISRSASRSVLGYSHNRLPGLNLELSFNNSEESWDIGDSIYSGLAEYNSQYNLGVSKNERSGNFRRSSNRAASNKSTKSHHRHTIGLEEFEREGILEGLKLVSDSVNGLAQQGNQSRKSSRSPSVSGSKNSLNSSKNNAKTKRSSRADSLLAERRASNMRNS